MPKQNLTCEDVVSEGAVDDVLVNLKNSKLAEKGSQHALP